MNIIANIQKRDNALLVLLFAIFLWASVDRLKNSLSAVIISDTEGYYMYLPAVFIYHDFHHLPIRSANNRVNEKGEIVIKYTCGLTFFYLPFFLAGHLYAHLFHYETSGLSAPYSYAIIISGLFWSFIGLYVLKKLLRKYFTWGATWLTLLAIALGTNFFIYATLFMGMSHVYSFALVAIILFVLDKYYAVRWACSPAGWYWCGQPTVPSSL